MTTRRSPGEGTDIVLGADGRYHAWLSMGVKSGGRRDRRHVSGKTRAEAARKLRGLQAKRDAGVVLEAGRSPTAAQWLTHYVEAIAAPKLRPSTLARYPACRTTARASPRASSARAVATRARRGL
jgi:hypothetical protein